MKTVVIWAIAHLLVASWVADEMRRRGHSEDEAQLAAHAAGAAAGFVLTQAL